MNQAEIAELRQADVIGKQKTSAPTPA
jgi:hypothetical protein